MMSRQPSTEEVLAAGHIAVELGRINRSSFAESQLLAMGLERHIEVLVSSFGLVPSLLLFAAAAALLLELNRRMRGNFAYAAAALCGLVAVVVEQSRSALPGAGVATWVAAAIAALLAAQTLWLRARRTRRA